MNHRARVHVLSIYKKTKRCMEKFMSRTTSASQSAHDPVSPGNEIASTYPPDYAPKFDSSPETIHSPVQETRDSDSHPVSRDRESFDPTEDSVDRITPKIATVSGGPSDTRSVDDTDSLSPGDFDDGEDTGTDTFGTRDQPSTGLESPPTISVEPPTDTSEISPETPGGDQVELSSVNLNLDSIEAEPETPETDQSELTEAVSTLPSDDSEPTESTMTSEATAAGHTDFKQYQSDLDEIPAEQVEPTDLYPGSESSSTRGEKSVSDIIHSEDVTESGVGGDASSSTNAEIQVSPDAGVEDEARILSDTEAPTSTTHDQVGDAETTAISGPTDTVLEELHHTDNAYGEPSLNFTATASPEPDAWPELAYPGFDSVITRATLLRPEIAGSLLVGACSVLWLLLRRKRAIRAPRCECLEVIQQRPADKLPAVASQGGPAPAHTAQQINNIRQQLQSIHSEVALLREERDLVDRELLDTSTQILQTISEQFEMVSQIDGSMPAASFSSSDLLRELQSPEPLLTARYNKPPPLDISSPEDAHHA